MNRVALTALALLTLSLGAALATPSSGSASGSGSLNFTFNGSVLGSFLGVARNISQEILDGVQALSRKSAADIRAFDQHIKAVAQALSRDAAQNAETLGNNIRSAVAERLDQWTATIRAFRINLAIQLQHVQNDIKRRALTDVQRVLEELDISARELSENLAALREKWQLDIEQEEQRILSSWNIWAVEELERVAVATNGSREALEAAQDVINAAVNRYSGILNKAADEAQGQLDSFEERVGNTTLKYQNLIDDLIEQVHDCLLRTETIRASKLCETRTHRELNALQRVLVEVEQLAQEALDLAANRYRRRLSVVQTLAEFEIEKFAINQKLNVIIEAHVSAGSTTASSGNASEDSTTELNTSTSSA